MKVLAAVLLSLSLYRPQAVPNLPSAHPQEPAARNGGRWYLAETGHAVYCYGPVRIVQLPDGGLQRVATFCQGANLVVPLKD